MSDLVVRAYNVGFGDAILVSVPERTARGRATTRHLLIDVGNLLAGEGNADDVFLEVVRDIADRTNGVVDLYVMTHEHLDHVQGLRAAHDAGVPLAAKYAWLTGSAHPTYYEDHPDAKKKRRKFQLALEDARRLQQAEFDPWLEMMIMNNAFVVEGSLGLTTAQYVDHLRTIAPANRTHYVHRTTPKAGPEHPFREAKLRILAPEENTSAYYGRAPRGPSLTAASGSDDDERATRLPAGLPAPPPGVDPGAFFDLVRSRRDGIRRQVMEIDQANNNTSVVLEVEWCGWRLLFPGDAEVRSWRLMHQLGVLRPVHLIKIAHHGSHNGTDREVLDELLPEVALDGRDRHAVVSTHTGDWPSVPDGPTLDLYASRATLHDTRAVERGSCLELRFPRV